MSLKGIKNRLAYNKLEKQFESLDSEYFKLNKQSRLKPGSVDRDTLKLMSERLGGTAFDLNQAHMSVGGDGDRASYDDVGKQGFDAVVKRQEKLRKNVQYAPGYSPEELKKAYEDGGAERIKKYEKEQREKNTK